MADLSGSASPGINDRELNGYIVNTLRAAPEELQGLDAIMAAQRVNLRTVQRDSEQAELDARINTVANGKNADERKLQQEAAISASPAVKMARNMIAEIEATIAETEVDQKMLARRFQSALALAELQSARLNLMSTASRMEIVK